MLGGLARHDPRAKAVQPIPGVTEWHNPRNGVYVAEVHYSADPEKRGDAWKRETQQGLDLRAWKREYEIGWDIADGQPVFPEYEPGEMRREFPVLPGARLLRFWDFGHVCPVTLFAQLDLSGRLRMIAELVLSNEGLEQQITSTKALSIDVMGTPDPPVFDAGDPAAEKEMDLGQVRAKLMRHGIILRCQPSNAGSYDNFRDRLTRRVRVEGEGTTPAFLVHPRCAVLHTALAGGFHRNPKTGKIVDQHPDKDVCDAARYGNDNLAGTTSAWFKTMQEVAKADCAW